MPETLTHKARTRWTRGFTLIEMLAVIAIVTVITGVTIVNKKSFNDSVTLTNLAYDVALTIREAQVYGTAVRSSLNGATVTFTNGYGVNFDEVSQNALITQYRFFIDGSGGPQNLQYDSGETELKRYTLAPGYSFFFCIGDNVSWPLCSNTASNGTQKISIVFKRPDPDANFTIDTGGQPAVPNLNRIRITVVAPNGNQREVAVYKNGQIVVCRPTIGC